MRSRQTPRAELRFDAIGTRWQIDTAEPLPADLVALVHDRVELFDRTYSRFRNDSLVTRIATTPGSYEFPPDAGALFALYRALYESTDAAMSPLVGRTLETLGYDRGYALSASPRPAVVPSWEDSISWDGSRLSTVRPVVLDVGAAGKGYLVDIVGGLLRSGGVGDFVVDASGDLLHSGATPLRVGLEHPNDPAMAIGIALVDNAALCASASNRRAWGDGIHHIIDATTGVPVRRVVATWVVAATGLVADGLATALFVGEPERLRPHFDFEYVRMFSNGRIDRSAGFEGELFA